MFDTLDGKEAGILKSISCTTSDKTAHKCPKCGTPLYSFVSSCPKCGIKLKVTPVFQNK